MTTDLPGQPNLTQLAEAMIDAASEQIRVAIPGVITHVDSSLRAASVQPAIRRADSDADPVIPGVPLLFPRFAGGQLTWPVAAGDACLLVFADRSIEEWGDAGGDREVEPADPRSHDLTDAMALPLGPGTAEPGREGDVSARLNGAELRLQDDGKVALGNADRSGTYTNHTPGVPVQWSGACELVQLLVDVLDALVIKTPIVDLSIVPGALLPTTYDFLAEARAKLNAIKGSL